MCEFFPCLVAWLPQSLPSFSIVTLPSCGASITNPSPAHLQAAVFSPPDSLLMAEQTKQRLGWGRTKCGGAGEVTLRHPTLACFENEWLSQKRVQASYPVTVGFASFETGAYSLPLSDFKEWKLFFFFCWVFLLSKNSTAGQLNHRLTAACFFFFIVILLGQWKALFSQFRCLPLFLKIFGFALMASSLGMTLH